MTVTENLRKYREMRNFRVTPEPRGRTRIAPRTGALLFVVQKHQASHLHYDLRLEISGVLKSWAVPKGPSLDPKVKRLAMPTEDHPLEYAEFEGVIPEGEYGAGAMIVWDRGTWQLGSGSDPLRAYESGKLRMMLSGQKLAGEFSLYRLPDRERGWLLVKIKDADARPGSDIADEEPASIVSGLSVEQMLRRG